MSVFNQDQIAYWNGEVGQRWAACHGALDAVFTPFTEALFARAALAPGARVLDIGCGAGETALMAARRVGPGGRVTGADLSEPLLAAARARAAGEPAGAAPVDWLAADAQSHDFRREAADGFDHALSRFGVMFFADSVAAFANIRRALAENGRLTFLCWRGVPDNPWVALPREAVLRVVPDLEPPPPDAPGPFRFAERAHLLSILEAAGFRAVACEAVAHDMTLGESPEAAADFVVTRGPCARLLRDRPPEAQAAALAAVTETLSARAGTGPVALGAACWLVSAIT